MERLSARKRLAIARQYLSGLSYDEIAARNGVSKGTVANVVSDLKAGNFPEAADLAEHIELLRELSLDLKRSKLSPGQCAAGLLFLTRINECGLDPADIGRWPMILKLVRSEDEAQEFVRLVYSIQEVQNRTGLDLDALDNKACELERKTTALEPVADRLKESKKQLAELIRKQEQLTSSVAVLEKKNELLTPRVKDLEKREQTLSRRIADMEPKVWKAEATISALNREMQKLNDIGLSLKELAEFNDRLQAIAQQHAIDTAEMRNRLFSELESLDKVLAVETLIYSRQQELDKMEQTITRTKKEIEATKAINASLKQEKANLDAGIKETGERVRREIAKVIPIAQDTIDRLRKELQRGNEEALAEIQRVKDEAVQIGREVGRYEGILQVNEWLNELLALMRGEESVTGQQVRTIVLSVVRGMAAWLKSYESRNFGVSTILFAANNLIRELEQWQV